MLPDDVRNCFGNILFTSFSFASISLSGYKLITGDDLLLHLLFINYVMFITTIIIIITVIVIMMTLCADIFFTCDNISKIFRVFSMLFDQVMN